MRALCNICGASFEIEVREEADPGGGALQFFLCTECGAHYPIAHISSRGLELRADLERLRAEPGPPDDSYQTRFERVLRRYQREIVRVA